MTVLMQKQYKIMNITPIKTETDYRTALKKMETLFDAPVGTLESDKADILALLIDDYEKKHYSIEAPNPIAAIKIRMEEMQLKQKDLVPVIGSKSRVSSILNRKRKLTVDMIRNLNYRLSISPKILIRDYELA
jgi:HTH-type transcriptional regulator/antitoxin HigA